MEHVEHRLQACIDGELDPREAAAVRAHCISCPRCGRALAELEVVGRALDGYGHALDAARPAAASASLWPLIEARLRREDRWRRTTGRPRLRPAFALGAGLAIAAGLMLGLRLGHAPLPGVTASDAGVAFLETGSLLDGDGATTLDEVYLTASVEEP